MRSIYLALFAIPFTFAACGGGDSSGGGNGGGGQASGGGASVDSDGNCTYAYLNDHNDIVDATKEVKSKMKYAREQELLESLAKLDRACDKFLNHHLGTRCRAKVEGTDQFVSAEERAESCAAVKKMVSGEQSPNRDALPRTSDGKLKSAPAPELDDTRLVKDLPARSLKATVLDSAKVKTLATAENHVAIGGDIGLLQGFKERIRLDLPTICTVRVTNSANLPAGDYPVFGTEDAVMRKNPSMREVYFIMNVKDNDFAIACMKHTNGPFTMGEIAYALRGIIQITGQASEK